MPRFFLLAALLVLSSAAARAQTPELAAPAAKPDFDHAERSPYLRTLIDSAHAKHLATTLQWQSLLHYHPRTFGGGMESQVDGSDFFMSAQGKRNPEAELDATLTAFFSDAPLPPNNVVAACRFAARFRWLDEQLSFDPQQLAQPECAQITALRKGVQADGLTLIFPAGQPNNPSSMFGHTLLRVDKRGQTSETRMLSYAINYAASTEEHEGVSYMVKGLIGGYPGRFDINPYYYKLREYSDLDSRDIWEYHLKLTPDQVERVLLHVYELAPTYFQYYFFDENCSYHLLALIGSAVPELQLTEQLPHPWVIPADVVRVLTQAGLIDSVQFEPSARARVQARRRGLSRSEQALTLALYNHQKTLEDPALTTLPAERQAAVLDLLYDYIKVARTSAKRHLDTRINTEERAVLKARAKLTVASANNEVPVPETRPEQGHRTGRVMLGGGSLEGRGFGEIGWRGGYHGLFDPAAGYRPFSNLEIGNVVLRHYSRPDEWRIQQLDFANVLSLEPQDPFFKTVSWRLRAGLDTVLTKRSDVGSVFNLKSGWGTTRALTDSQQTVLYLMGDATADLGPALHDGYRIGPAVAVGLLSQITHCWRAGLTFTATHGLLGEQRTQGDVTLEQNWALGHDFSLDLKASRSRALNREWGNELGAGLRYYF